MKKIKEYLIIIFIIITLIILFIFFLPYLKKLNNNIGLYEFLSLIIIAIETILTFKLLLITINQYKNDKCEHNETKLYTNYSYLKDFNKNFTFEKNSVFLFGGKAANNVQKLKQIKLNELEIMECIKYNFILKTNNEFFIDNIYLSKVKCIVHLKDSKRSYLNDCTFNCEKIGELTSNQDLTMKCELQICKKIFEGLKDNRDKENISYIEFIHIFIIKTIFKINLELIMNHTSGVKFRDGNIYIDNDINTEYKKTIKILKN